MALQSSLNPLAPCWEPLSHQAQDSSGSTSSCWQGPWTWEKCAQIIFDDNGWEIEYELVRGKRPSSVYCLPPPMHYLATITLYMGRPPCGWMLAQPLSTTATGQQWHGRGSSLPYHQCQHYQCQLFPFLFTFIIGMFYPQHQRHF